MSNISERSTDDSATPFVDPWGHEISHQGDVPNSALFIGEWQRDLGIDELSEALFLVRDDRSDLLWSLTTNTEKFTRENLNARSSGDPDWLKAKITCACVAGAPSQLSQSEAAARLLGALARSRVPYEFPRSPYIAGLLAVDELAHIVQTIAGELERNAPAAEAAQRGNESPILKLARELNLHPRPAGHNDSAWIADCPRRKHTIMISPALNAFGCGYCRRSGGAPELQELYDHVGPL